MKIAVAAGLLLSIASVLALAQVRSKPNNEEGRIRALEVAWNHAERAKDAAALSQLLSESLIFVDYDGTLMTKAQFLAATKDPSSVTEQLINEGMTVHMYDDTAIVTGTYRDKGKERGKPYFRHGRFTDTWVRQGSSWQCVASQSTLISH